MKSNNNAPFLDAGAEATSNVGANTVFQDGSHAAELSNTPDLDRVSLGNILLIMKVWSLECLREEKYLDATEGAEQALSLVKAVGRTYSVLEYAYNLCEIYEEIELYENIVSPLLGALDSSEQCLSKEPYLLDAMIMLARIYYSVEDLEEAEIWFRKAIDLVERCGILDMRAASAMRGLALTLLDLERLVEAEEWARKPLRLVERICGKRDEETKWFEATLEEIRSKSTSGTLPEIRVEQW